jgi:glutamyl-tRNA reductase
MIVALSAGRTAPQELRGRLALDEEGQRKLLAGPRPGLAELVVLSTCHRTEIYATGDGLDSDVVHSVAAVMPGLAPTDQHDVKFMSGTEAVQHLFRVASGLDSLVIGETQVLGQVRRALVMAEETGAAGPVLANIFGRAIRLGRTVRNQTPLGRLGESIASVAADFLELRLKGLAGRKVLIVGAGQVASEAARSCYKADAQLTVISRTIQAAERLAEETEAKVRPMDELLAALAECEAAIVAISGGLLLSRAGLMAMKSGPSLILDLSMPRAVEAAQGLPVEVRSLEELPGPRGPEITEGVIEAEALVSKEVAELQHWADTRASGPAIQELHSFAEEVVSQELSRTLAGLDLSSEQAERVRLLGQRIANKLLHGPTIELRRAGEADRATIRRIFRLGG